MCLIPIRSGGTHFSFRYANYADALFRGAAALLEWAAEQDDEITDLTRADGLVDDVDEETVRAGVVYIQERYP